tara:strand:- start:54613 stop:56223 length:1611 start_codon:yes stop_codon:yes gene_type:complete
MLAGTTHAAWAVTCDEALTIAVEGVTLTDASAQAAGDGLPAHCILHGEMGARTGDDGQPYALRFELRLPDTWDGRFMHQFNGGNDGEVKPALGMWSNLPDGTGALARGMAVVSSDAGHDGAARPETGLVAGNAFGFDFEARRMYGYGAVAMLNPAALELTTAYYGHAPDYSYGAGTSNGGRHAMVAAERMPGAFDGILAGYPGFNLPRAALQHAWDVQSFRSAGPSLAKAFSPADMAVAADKITQACDALDGLEDGMVFDLKGCQAAFDPDSMTCTADMQENCLRPEQTAALVRIHKGPHLADGTALYSDWAWDPGLASGGWRFWKLESPIPPWGKKPIIAVMGAGSLAQVFTTPPSDVDGTPEALENYLMNFDFEASADAINATTAAFPESAMQVMTPPHSDNPTLAEFQAEGGKLLIFHGQADPVFSILDTIKWFDTLHSNTPEADEFTRLYTIPGMPHGAGGNAADEADLLGALIDWVEQDKAPGALTAHVRTANDEAASNMGASRPLCPYPSFAVYTGDNPAMADSFTCSDS